jgi:hypothetical protein
VYDLAILLHIFSKARSSPPHPSTNQEPPSCTTLGAKPYQAQKTHRNDLFKSPSIHTNYLHSPCTTTNHLPRLHLYAHHTPRLPCRSCSLRSGWWPSRNQGKIFEMSGYSRFRKCQGPDVSQAGAQTTGDVTPSSGETHLRKAVAVIDQRYVHRYIKCEKNVR